MNWIKLSEQKPELNEIIILATGYFGKLEENYSGTAPYRIGFIKYADAKSYCESLDHEVYWVDPSELLINIELPIELPKE